LFAGLRITGRLLIVLGPRLLLGRRRSAGVVAGAVCVVGAIGLRFAGAFVLRLIVRVFLLGAGIV
jgi:hypothetical protein